MDGVPFLTQCPVLPNALFRYEFYADEAGTHFYHSHSGGHDKIEHVSKLLIVTALTLMQRLSN